MTAFDSFAQLGWVWLIQSTLFLAMASALIWLSGRWGPGLQSLVCRWGLVGTLLLPFSFNGLVASGLSGPLGKLSAVGQSSQQLSETAARAVSADAEPEEDWAARQSMGDVEPGDRSAETVEPGRAEANALGAGPGRFHDRAMVRLRVVASWFTVHTMQYFLVVGWCLVSSVLLARLGMAWFAVQGMVKRSKLDARLSDHCASLSAVMKCRCLQVRRSTEVTSPCLWGIRRPVLLVPCTGNEQSGSETEVSRDEATGVAFGYTHNILLHELGHVMRRDACWNWLFKLSLAIFPCQPWLWWLAKRHELASEQACDDFVLLQGGHPAAYASQLVDLASLRLSSHAIAVAMVARPSMLAVRVRRIMDSSCQRAIHRSLSMQCLLLLVLALVGAFSTFMVLPPAVLAAQPPGAKDATDDLTKATVSDQALRLSGQILAVDGKPAAGAQIELKLPSDKRQSLAADGQGRFDIVLRVPVDYASGVTLSVRSSDGAQLICHRLLATELVGNVANIKLQLQSVRTIKLTVMARDGQPVSDAKVLLQTQPELMTTYGLTDSSGMATLKLPAGERVEVVVAWKDGLGLDYVSYSMQGAEIDDKRASAPEFPKDGKLALTLAGSRTAEIFVSDRQSRAVTDVSFYPWLLNKAGQPELNLTMMQEFFARTPDSNGKIVFEWFPTWQTGPCTFVLRSSTFVNEQHTYDPRQEGPLRIQLDRLVRVAGRAIGPDGKPAAGVRLRTAGRSQKDFYTDHFGMVTDGDGRFETLLPPDYLYMIVSDDARLVSEHEVFVVGPETPIADKVLALRQGTRVYGAVKSLSSGELVPNVSLQTLLEGPFLPTDGAGLTDSKGNRLNVQPMANFAVKTDNGGRFELYLGNGKYHMRALNGVEQSFEVKDQVELEINLIGGAEPIMFMGQVVLKADRSTVSGALLSGGSVSSASVFRWKETADERGMFMFERPQHPTYVQVLSADGKSGVLEKIGSETKQLTFQLVPTGTARGRLVSQSGLPLKNHRISYAMALPDAEPDTSIIHFHQTAETDGNGEFQLENLVADREYMLWEIDPAAKFPGGFIARVRVDPGEQRNLGDQRVK